MAAPLFGETEKNVPSMKKLKKELTKKPRGNNYLPKEKDILIDTISKFKHIVENKRTDGVTIRQKEEAWSNICQEYNSQVSVRRDPFQLKTCYENMKKKARKSLLAEEKGELVTPDETSTKLNAMLGPNFTVSVSETDFDSDSKNDFDCEFLHAEHNDGYLRVNSPSILKEHPGGVNKPDAVKTENGLVCDPINSSRAPGELPPIDKKRRIEMDEFERALISSVISKKPEIEDESYHFAMSIVPTLRSLEDYQLCEAKIKIMTLLQDIKYNN